MEQLEKLIQVLGFLGFEKSPDQTIRKIKFWNYELQSQVLQLPTKLTLDRLNQLRNFLFEDKKIMADADHSSGDCFSFEKLIDQKKGTFFTLALLFKTLASDLDLQIEMVKVADHRWLKWISELKNEYLDLADKARALSGDEVLQRLVQSTLNSNSVTDKSDDFKPLCFKDCMISYLSPLESYFKAKNDRGSLMNLYDLQIKLAPSSIRYLSERALLLLDLGERKEAYQDLKRYFYLSDERTTNPDLKYLYEILSREEDRTTQIQFH